MKISFYCETSSFVGCGVGQKRQRRTHSNKSWLCNTTERQVQQPGRDVEVKIDWVTAVRACREVIPKDGAWLWLCVARSQCLCSSPCWLEERERPTSTCHFICMEHAHYFPWLASCPYLFLPLCQSVSLSIVFVSDLSQVNSWRNTYAKHLNINCCCFLLRCLNQTDFNTNGHEGKGIQTFLFCSGISIMFQNLLIMYSYLKISSKNTDVIKLHFSQSVIWR